VGREVERIQMGYEKMWAGDGRGGAEGGDSESRKNMIRLVYV
jgi:hypothetical protein